MNAQGEAHVGEDPPKIDQCRGGEGTHGSLGARPARRRFVSGDDLQPGVVGDVAPQCLGDAPPPGLPVGCCDGVNAPAATMYARAWYALSPGPG